MTIVKGINMPPKVPALSPPFCDLHHTYRMNTIYTPCTHLWIKRLHFLLPASPA
jgi:hypothetical protein